MSRFNFGLHAGERYMRIGRTYSSNAGHNKDRELERKALRMAPATLEAFVAKASQWPE